MWVLALSFVDDQVDDVLVLICGRGLSFAANGFVSPTLLTIKMCNIACVQQNFFRFFLLLNLHLLTHFKFL